MGDDAAGNHVGAVADPRRVMTDGRGGDAEILQVVEAGNPRAVAADAGIVEYRSGGLEFRREVGGIDPAMRGVDHDRAGGLRPDAGHAVGDDDRSGHRCGLARGDGGLASCRYLWGATMETWHLAELSAAEWFCADFTWTAQTSASGRHPLVLRSIGPLHAVRCQQAEIALGGPLHRDLGRRPIRSTVDLRTLSRPVKRQRKNQIMRHNRLRALLNANEPSIGTHLLSSWPTLVELVGDAGNYDYVEFTAEYAPFHMHDLDNLGRALELKNLGGMIKIEQTQWTHQAMRAIGSGFQSVLFADLRTVADAEACVAAVRAETPGTGGRLGVGMRRDVGTVREGGSPAYVEALNEVVIAIMVEKRECVEDLDAILSVKGLDMVQFGSSDYSMSLGLTGQRNHPDVVKAERRTIETALKKGLHPRVELADIKQAAPYLEMGVKHFCIGWDVRILHDWWRINGEGMRAMLPSPGSTAPDAVSKPRQTVGSLLTASASARGCTTAEPIHGVVPRLPRA